MQICKITEFVKEVTAIEIIPRFNNLKENDIIQKEAGELVTNADLEAEKEITAILQSLYPTCVVSGEEDIATNPVKLDEIIKAERAFLIDPVDGTNNFIKGQDHFAVMIVALNYGDVVASWIYWPLKNKFAVAEKGSGAYINDKKIKLGKEPDNIADMIGAAHIKRLSDEIRPKVKENLKSFKENKPAFSAGCDYIYLCEGVKHFSTYYRTLLWDHLPGTLLLKEAGGYFRQLDGREYTSKNEGQGLLSTTSEENWFKIREAMFRGI